MQKDPLNSTTASMYIPRIRRPSKWRIRSFIKSLLNSLNKIPFQSQLLWRFCKFWNSFIMFFYSVNPLSACVYKRDDGGTNGQIRSLYRATTDHTKPNRTTCHHWTTCHHARQVYIRPTTETKPDLSTLCSFLIVTPGPLQDDEALLDSSFTCNIIHWSAVISHNIIQYTES